MTPRDLALILTVVAVWGMNFIFIRIGLDHMPPLVLATLRFFFCAVPAVFFIPRPKCSWRMLTSYGLVIFGLQFTLLFYGMKVGMPPGLASLVLQLQVCFTMALASWLLNEKISFWKGTGAAISIAGIFILALHTDMETTFAGLALTLLSAFAWACGSIISKQIGRVNPVALVVWGSLIATPFFVIATVLIEPWSAIRHSFTEISWVSVSAVAYIVYLSTHFGYSMWSYLLSKYPASSVVPFTLLVPIIGFLSSAYFLGEVITVWKILAGICIILGLTFNILGDRWFFGSRRSI